MADPVRRVRPSFVLPSLLLPAALVACGGTPTTSTTPTASAAASSSAAPVPVADDAPDMSPVTKPANVFLTARFASIAQSVDGLDQLLKLPRPLRAQLDAQVERKGATFLDLNATLDVAVALDASSKGEPKPIWAVSFPVKSVEDALAAAKKAGADTTASGPGAYHVRGKGFVCDLGPSLGAPQYRAVCGDREAGIEVLGPWLVRGLAAEPKPTTDAWARLDFVPFTSKILGQFREEGDEIAAKVTRDISRALPKADKELLEAPVVLEGEVMALLGDLDFASGTLDLDASKPSIDVSFDAHFKSKASWIAGIVDEAVTADSTPPELFFRLPKDATTAFYGHSTDPAKFTGVRRVVRKAMEGLLEFGGNKLKMSDADKKAVLAWIDGLPTTSGAWVSASGHAPQKAIPAKDLTAQQAMDGFKAEIQGLLPWQISGGDGDPATSIAWLKLTEDAINKVVADVKAVAGKDAAKLTFLPVAKVTNNPAGYPKGSSELTITVSVTSKLIWNFLPMNRGTEHPAGAEAKGDVAIHIVVVPDADNHYWWGYAADGDALKSHLNAVVKGAAATGQLSARTDLEPLKTHRGFGGFVSLGGMLGALTPMAERRTGDKLKAVLDAAPHKLAGNIFILGGGTPGATPSISISASLGKDWVEDLSAIIGAAMK